MSAAGGAGPIDRTAHVTYYGAGGAGLTLFSHVEKEALRTISRLVSSKKLRSPFVFPSQIQNKLKQLFPNVDEVQIKYLAIIIVRHINDLEPGDSIDINKDEENYNWRQSGVKVEFQVDWNISIEKGEGGKSTIVIQLEEIGRGSWKKIHNTVSFCIENKICKKKITDYSWIKFVPNELNEEDEEDRAFCSLLEMPDVAKAISKLHMLGVPSIIEAPQKIGESWVQPKYDGSLKNLFTVGCFIRCQITLRETLVVIEQILQSVSKLNETHVHRDLNLNNILYRRNENGQISIKISDWESVIEKKKKTGMFGSFTPRYLNKLEDDSLEDVIVEVGAFFDVYATARMIFNIICSGDLVITRNENRKLFHMKNSIIYQLRDSDRALKKLIREKSVWSEFEQLIMNDPRLALFRVELQIKTIAIEMFQYFNQAGTDGDKTRMTIEALWPFWEQMKEVIDRAGAGGAGGEE